MHYFYCVVTCLCCYCHNIYCCCDDELIGSCAAVTACFVSFALKLVHNPTTDLMLKEGPQAAEDTGYAVISMRRSGVKADEKYEEVRRGQISAFPQLSVCLSVCLFVLVSMRRSGVKADEQYEEVRRRQISAFPQLSVCLSVCSFLYRCSVKRLAVDRFVEGGNSVKAAFVPSSYSEGTNRDAIRLDLRGTR